MPLQVRVAEAAQLRFALVAVLAATGANRAGQELCAALLDGAAELLALPPPTAMAALAMDNPVARLASLAQLASVCAACGACARGQALAERRLKSPPRGVAPRPRRPRRAGPADADDTSPGR